MTPSDLVGNPDQARQVLQQTFQDHRLSRPEKANLTEIALQATPEQLAMWRNLAFDIAREECGANPTGEVLRWLENVNRVLIPSAAPSSVVEAYFSPGDGPRSRIVQALRSAQSQVNICVFTITDNEVSKEISAAHARGTHIRIITDNDKSEDRGSDIERLADQGIAVRMDVTDHHMHHKFALFDQRIVLTGSYNWTRSAVHYNQENIIVSSAPVLLEAFIDEFEKLWEHCRPLT